jgi:CRISPR-associated protein (TIGR03986 family)
MTDFNNPYNFVPALPRHAVSGELGDRPPTGHSIYHDNHWSGTITVQLTTQTPLLIPDAATLTTDHQGHKTYGLRTVNGLPYLPATSIKGMLRSAYEAVTNSRLSIFVNHDDRLAYRMSTKAGLRMVPVRVEEGKLHLLCGVSDINADGSPDGAMYAAWLPRYHRGQISRQAVRYPDGSLPQHQDTVKAYVELIQHHRWDKNQKKHILDFQYLQVLEVVRPGESLSKQRTSRNTEAKSERSYHKPLEKCMEITGYVCITNPNIDRKHDERIFFDAFEEPIKVDLTPKLRQQWNQLIANYQQEHRDEICEKKWTSPPALNDSVWSRHIMHERDQLAESERNLADGTLCYALVNNEDSEHKVLGLYPVTISRDLFDCSPLQLLHPSLRPTESIQQLSPADRVFGWVRQSDKQEETTKTGSSAYKGQLRIHSVECCSPDSIEEFTEHGLPLAILGQPKPQQGKFYTAKDRQGKAFEDRTDKSKTYQNSSQGLRGRKVYPHHKDLPADHWSDPMRDRTQQANNGHYQEYRRPTKNGDERDDQNRSITAWVKPGATFTFRIDVINLSEVELGALLYLLSLPQDQYHRLGGGKPLGFGSIHLEVDQANTELKTGQSLRAFYSTLTALQNPDPADWQSTVSTFKQAVVQSYANGKRFEDVPFIAAFAKAAEGYSGPVHYPRITPQPHPDGESFKWFVENEAQSRGKKLALPELTSDRRLPLDPTYPQHESSKRR